MRQRAIGIFDSGIGGLTVARALRERLPHEDLVYLGDTARLPYGSKSPAVVARYAMRCGRFLMARGVKMVVVACNTASSSALGALSDALPVPVIGVIEPGAVRAAAATRRQRIAILATRGTIDSGSYRRQLQALLPQVCLVEVACPLWVPLAEEGWVDHPATWAVSRDYLARPIAQGVDTAILGCTHYPLLEATISRLLGPQVHIVNSAAAVADSVAACLETEKLTFARRRPGTLQLFCTDLSPGLGEAAGRFLGGGPAKVFWVDLA